MTTHILASSNAAAVIAAGSFVLFLVFSAIFGKKAEKSVPRLQLGGPQAEAARARAELQRRAEAARQSLARGPAKPPALPPQASRGRQAKAARKAVAAVAQKVATPIATPSPRAAPPRPVAAESVAGVAHRQATSKAGHTLKLLLRRGGIREAVLLSEVIGPPLSLRDGGTASPSSV